MIDRIRNLLAPKPPVVTMDDMATQARLNELQALVENDTAPAFLSSADMHVILKALAVYIRDLERRVRDMQAQHELAELTGDDINPRVMAKALADMGKARDLYNHLRDESEARWQSTR